MITFDQKGQNVQTQYNAERITIYQRIENAIGNFRSPDANRARFLVRLYARYSAILAQSLQGAMLFALGLHTRLEAVNSPTRLVFRHLDTEERALPQDTSITQVYDEAGGEILLLGEPGSSERAGERDKNTPLWVK
ncbi:hypothetical protein [Ktedonobacter robiniae]|uniref:Baseplate assembly protein n=1 Tax=Ktedonobacter robiniae TaxID=2778365 RepID=A0ABQ3UUW3_9CHLR|nr:hypothetical protein [Ktedonobacter robiniae]GHO56210.1 hypothetical protein KSB_46850 [Ktedonobacter robiniae]